MTWESVRDLARGFSVEDRLMLLGSLWDDMAEEPVLTELSPEFQQELDRRLENCKTNPQAGRPWQEVMAELQSENHVTSHPAT